jgi:hypothetical protein
VRPTNGEFGTVAGAVYVTDVLVTLVSVPHVAAVQEEPSVQVTPALRLSPWTVAVKFRVVPTCTPTEFAGEIATVIPGGARLTVLVLVLVVSACDVART